MAERQIRHMTDAADLVRIAAEGIENGHLRLWNDPTPPKESIGYYCRRWMSHPETPEVIAADWGRKRGSSRTREAFNEEIEAIRAALDAANVKAPTATWQQGTTPGADGFWNKMNRLNLARQIWDWYAIPLRRSGDMVEVIHSTSDVLSMPLITTYSIEEFVQRAVDGAVRAELELESTRTSLTAWKRVGVVALVAMGVFVVFVL